MRKLLIRLLVTIAVIIIGFGVVPPAQAASGILTPCSESSAFQQRKSSAPDNYYFNKPYEAYSAFEVCGEDGLPHLPITLGTAVDVAIPFVLFHYVAGFIGWSARSYLIAANKSSNPEEKEIFIDLPLMIASIIQGLLWPLLALKELTTGELTAKANEVYVSPR
ncbi:MAG: Photosystem I reaction center subunit III [Leptolyngbyaceae cyanobacterium RU_5_1]|nr:Photosystem I reaction center subunit III [Leptolyngbyaceae cyanobacterium RU_5_1]